MIKFNYAVKKYDLLLKKHFDKKITFLKHVFHYLIEIIQSI